MAAPLKKKILKNFCLLCAILIGESSSLKAQLTDFGQNPPSIYWRTLHTLHFNLIFPAELSWRAEKLASTLERIYSVENHSIPVKTQRISIILQNQPIESNAFVLLAPRRSEFNTMPPQDLEPIDWLNSLAVHEMRHVVQIDRVFNGKGSPILETLQLAIFGLVYPPWFFEGDAVGMETLLTDAGRGRLPFWDIDLRANLLSEKNYSYSKYTLGSNKDNVPDYYHIGYFMVTKIRRDYGDSIFNKIYTGSLRLTPYPFSSSLKKQTGLNTNQFYQKTIAELRKAWTDSLLKTKVRQYKPLNHRQDSIATQYLLPKPFENGELLVLKQGLDQLPGIYILRLPDGGKASHKSQKIIQNKIEQKVITIGHQTNPNFDYKNGKMVWDETRNDPRYAYRAYSDLFEYDFSLKKKTKLTHQSKLFSPSLRSDGKSIVAVKVNTNYTFNLVVLDSSGLASIYSIPNPKNYFFETPSFDSTGNKIIAIAVNGNGKSIYEYDLSTKEERLLKPFSNVDLNRPIYGPSNTILYQSAKSGRDQIYMLNLANGVEKRLTDAKFGAYAPQKKGDTIYFENFSALGKNISQFSLKEEQKSVEPLKESEQQNPFHPIQTIVSNLVKDSQNTFIRYYEPLLGREPGSANEFKTAIKLDSVIREYPIRNYKELNHLFYFHSLLPSIQNLNLTENTNVVGLKLSSTNLLNTLQAYAGLYYQNGVGSLEYQAGFNYKRWYPEFNLNFKDKKNNALAIESSSEGDIYIPYTFRTNTYNIGLDIPLRFVSSKYNYTIDLQVSTSYSHKYSVSIPIARFRKFITNIAFPIHYALLLEKDRILAIRDISPKWGQNISLDFEHLPFSKNLMGRYFALNSSFYFPGIASHHSLRLSYNYQFTEGVYSSFRYLDEINGFSYLPLNPLRSTFLLNYSFPIAYPDWEMSRISYVRRLIGGFFYNAENLGADPTIYSSYFTYGAEIKADFNLFRFYLPIFQLGTKVIFFQKNLIKGPRFELILNYSI